MAEKFPTPENKMNREEILESLKTKGIEDAETKEALAQYIENTRKEVEKITIRKEHNIASIESSIDNALLFYEAGYIKEAFDDLIDTLEIAYQVGEVDLHSRITDLLDEIRPKLSA